LVSGGSEGNTNTNYPYNDIARATRKRRKASHVFQLYIPDEFQPTLSKFIETLEREGCSVSRWFREQAEQYVNLHSPGNPQQTLDRIIEIGKPCIAPQPCSFVRCRSGSVAIGLYKRDGKRYHLCNRHLHLAESSPNWIIERETDKRDREEGLSNG